MLACRADGQCPDFDFVDIIGGEFSMGYADGLASESPVHDVQVWTSRIPSPRSDCESISALC